jgi:NitT/TauT family transport system ATP-binding protein
MPPSRENAIVVVLMGVRPSSLPLLASQISSYELRAVARTFARRNVQAFDKVDLTLPQGEFAAVIGSSGCGKSTLLKIMAGLMPPSSGSAMLAGTPVKARGATSA